MSIKYQTVTLYVYGNSGPAMNPVDITGGRTPNMDELIILEIDGIERTFRVNNIKTWYKIVQSTEKLEWADVRISATSSAI